MTFKKDKDIYIYIICILVLYFNFSNVNFNQKTSLFLQSKWRIHQLDRSGGSLVTNDLCLGYDRPSKWHTSRKCQLLFLKETRSNTYRSNCLNSNKNRNTSSQAYSGL